jgi:hypothetical protein
MWGHGNLKNETLEHLTEIIKHQRFHCKGKGQILHLVMYPKRHQTSGNDQLLGMV